LHDAGSNYTCKWQANDEPKLSIKINDRRTQQHRGGSVSKTFSTTIRLSILHLPERHRRNITTFIDHASNMPKGYEFNKIRARSKKDWRGISKFLPSLIHLLMSKELRGLDFLSECLAEQDDERAVKHPTIVGFIRRK